MGRTFKRLLVTGGAGFIGSNFVRRTLAQRSYEVVVLDKLTYAGNLANLASVEADPRFTFIHGDIADPGVVQEAMRGCDGVLNFAAESHVDRSIMDGSNFAQTQVVGTLTLLEAARQAGVTCYLQVSTDEVYGHVEDGASREGDAPAPRSPYSATKAGADLVVNSYHITHGLTTVVTRGSNTYGPHQYPEKLLPVAITNAIDGKSIPVYGDGMQVRDWLHVDDHCDGIDRVLHEGVPGEAYNIGAEHEGLGHGRTNLEVLRALLDILGMPHDALQFVGDRPGHDRRYALDCEKLRALGWQAELPFTVGLERTVRWYAEHRDWWEPLKQDAGYVAYYNRNYGDRGKLVAAR
ncbi:MAG: dTDP-glucose 4,6-dehydratase [Chloroflexota bacterium]|nr:dTDP-glucose 4,6-dehydratase [Chloroflexota bacterium]